MSKDKAGTTTATGALMVSLRWRPWWPFPEDVAKALRSGRPVDWPHPDEGGPQSQRCVDEAVTVTRPLLEAWKTRS